MEEQIAAEEKRLREEAEKKEPTENLTLMEKLRSKNFNVKKEGISELQRDPHQESVTKELLLKMMKNEKIPKLKVELANLIVERKDLFLSDVGSLSSLLPVAASPNGYNIMKEMFFEFVNKFGVEEVYRSLRSHFSKEKNSNVKSNILLFIFHIIQTFGFEVLSNESFLDLLGFLNESMLNNALRGNSRHIINDVKAFLSGDEMKKLREILHTKFRNLGFDKKTSGSKVPLPPPTQPNRFKKRLRLDLLQNRKKEKLSSKLSKLNFQSRLKSSKKEKDKIAPLRELHELLVFSVQEDTKRDFVPLSNQALKSLTKTIVPLVKSKSLAIGRISIQCLQYLPYTTKSFIALVNAFSSNKKHVIDEVHKTLNSYSINLTPKLWSTIASSAKLKNNSVLLQFLIFLVEGKRIQIKGREIHGVLVNFVMKNGIVHNNNEVRNVSMKLFAKIQVLHNIQNKGGQPLQQLVDAEKKIDARKMKKIKSYVKVEENKMKKLMMQRREQREQVEREEQTLPPQPVLPIPPPPRPPSQPTKVKKGVKLEFGNLKSTPKKEKKKAKKKAEVLQFSPPPSNVSSSSSSSNQQQQRDFETQPPQQEKKGTTKKKKGEDDFIDERFRRSLEKKNYSVLCSLTYAPGEIQDAEGMRYLLLDSVSSSFPTELFPMKVKCLQFLHVFLCKVHNHTFLSYGSTRVEEVFRNRFLPHVILVASGDTKRKIQDLSLQLLTKMSKDEDMGRKILFPWIIQEMWRKKKDEGSVDGDLMIVKLVFLRHMLKSCDLFLKCSAEEIRRWRLSVLMVYLCYKTRKKISMKVFKASFKNEEDGLRRFIVSLDVSRDLPNCKVNKKQIYKLFKITEPPASTQKQQQQQKKKKKELVVPPPPPPPSTTEEKEEKEKEQAKEKKKVDIRKKLFVESEEEKTVDNNNNQEVPQQKIIEEEEEERVSRLVMKKKKGSRRKRRLTDIPDEDEGGDKGMGDYYLDPFQKELVQIISRIREMIDKSKNHFDNIDFDLFSKLDQKICSLADDSSGLFATKPSTLLLNKSSSPSLNVRTYKRLESLFLHKLIPKLNPETNSNRSTLDVSLVIQILFHFFKHCKRYIEKYTKENTLRLYLHRVFEVILAYQANLSEEEHDKDENVRKLNGLVYIMLRECDKTVLFSSLMSLLCEFYEDQEGEEKSLMDFEEEEEEEDVASPSKTILKEKKEEGYVKIVCKCLFTIFNSFLKGNYDEINLEVVLLELEKFLISIDPKSIYPKNSLERKNMMTPSSSGPRKKISHSELTLRTIKTIIHNIVERRGDEIRLHYSLVIDHKTRTNRETSVITKLIDFELKSKVLKKEADDIFKVIFDEKEVKRGLNMLYDFLVKHPHYNLSQNISKFSVMFQNFIWRKLRSIQSEREAMKNKASIRIEDVGRRDTGMEELKKKLEHMKQELKRQKDQI